MASSPQPGKLFLWNHPVSSYAQKVRIALRHKEIPFDFATPKGGGSGYAAQTDSDFSSQNPRIEMPMLVDGDLRIFDSTIILEYIEDKYPERPLLPAAKDDPVGRAKARMIEDICDTHYEAINWGLGEVNSFERAEGEAAEKLRRQAEHQIRQVHGWLAEQLGTDREWFVGGAFGWADLCVAIMVSRSTSHGIWPEEGGVLAKWFEGVKEVEAVKVTLQECSDALKSPPPFADIVRKGLMRRQYRDHRLEWMIKSGGVDVVLAGLEKKNIRFAWPDPLDS
ncbi:hypothetical protein LTR84_003960 [Exophiala bonariae]|uniref:GST N-terminal domain-containing protein n=1 Tax=Exophiala bonariae TaxID=1690606 RepID=A0AAV9N4Y8_9EURO|nr:hypothetical protein LTR84_003960 [Exophiala bonariae]